MKGTVRSAIGVLVVAAATGSLLAHHSLARFDTTTAVRVKGVIAHVAWINPHSILYVDEQRPDGGIRRWAAEGPAARQLERLGIRQDVFRVGDVIEVCGYTLKERSDLPRAVSSEPTSSNVTASAIGSGRVLAAEDLVLSDGRKRSWGDYGHHKCHGADDLNIHPISPLLSAPSPPDFPRRPQE
jgi:hypothetical protein